MKRVKSKQITHKEFIDILNDKIRRLNGSKTPYNSRLNRAKNDRNPCISIKIPKIGK